MFLALVWISTRAFGQGEEILHAFTGGEDGGMPYSSLTFDIAGNLYGTTHNGGAYGVGTIYELSPVSGGWKESVIHSFNNSDGYGPYGGVIFGASGNIYGTTGNGGKYNYGTVFKLQRGPKGGWEETVLYNFGSAETTGRVPEGNLVFDDDGNLYGTSFYGGENGGGTVWELSPPADKGDWSLKTLHTFGGVKDGVNPYAGVIIGSQGKLYGTTWIGGLNNAGIVFELTPMPQGPWEENILCDFNGTGAVGGLIFDDDGNLYGATFSNLIYRLTPSSESVWKESNLAVVANSPESTLVFDKAGNLYGTTLNGGSAVKGSVFELSPIMGGWRVTELHAFTGGADGAHADVGLAIDASGTLYGTTYAGGGTGCGGEGCGVVFQIKP
jgi:uncharacterized repeat protein (TIGR03803 family)